MPLQKPYISWLCIKEQVKQMGKQGKGEYSIVNIASKAAFLGFPNNCCYSACKNAIVGLTKSIAGEYGTFGIRVNAILPGGETETAILPQILPEGEANEQYCNSIPLKRLSHSSEIAKSVCFLLSNESSYMTGHSLILDGGMTSCA